MNAERRCVEDGGDPQPSFVMTLKLDDESFAILQDWRTRYFPARINFIPAHLTLLHKISAEQASRLQRSWREFEHLRPVRLKFAAPTLIGNGVAIDIDSVELHALRARLLDVIAGSLTRQDQQRFRPHVTIQNKVGADEAKALHASLGSCFEPWVGQGTAVLTWEYLGGPWQPVLELAFCGVDAETSRA